MDGGYPGLWSTLIYAQCLSPAPVGVFGLGREKIYHELGRIGRMARIEMPLSKIVGRDGMVAGPLELTFNQVTIGGKAFVPILLCWL